MSDPQTSALLWPWASSSVVADPCDAIRAEVTEHFLRHRDEIFRYLACTRCRADEAEEITQEVFLRLYLLRRQGTAVGNPRRWLFTVARNVSVDRLRRRRHERQLVDVDTVRDLDTLAGDTPGVDASLEAEDRRVALAAAIGELTPLQRECLHLRAHGHSLRDIAAMLGTTVSGVSDAVGRAVKRLRKGVHDRH